MTPEQKDILTTTWHQVAAMGEPAAALFYDRLFEIDPSTRPLFANTDMTEQHRKLLQTLAYVIAGLDKLDTLVGAVENLGRRHAGYGVSDDHYDSVGAALLWTLEQGLGEAWTDDARDAWTTAYTLLAGIMRDAQHQVAA